MHRIAFDVRTRLLTGMYRYGSTLLEHVGKCLPGTDVKVSVLYRPDTQQQAIEELSRSLPADHFELLAVSDNHSRIPRSLWIRDWVAREHIELYYSIDFVVDKELSVPFVYTVHDLLLLKYPSVFYNDDETFRAKFGLEEFALMERDLQSIQSYIPAHTDFLNGTPSITRYIGAMSRYLAEQSKHIITSSQGSKEDIIQQLSVPASKISVIPAAADSSLFYPRAHEEAMPVLEKYGLSENYCLGVGLDLKHKRLSWLMEVLAQCCNELPANARVVIVGRYDNLDLRLKQVRDLGLENLVVFPGRINDEELACLYSKAKALVVPSLDEGFGLPILEALMCRTEVIVPDTKVLREVAGSCGHFYEVEDRDQLADKIIRAFNGSLPLQAPYFENRFSWDTSAQQFLKLLELLLEGERVNAATAS
jgi:glycosyltransferase involved in cell wall biosynthesis